MAQCLHLLAKFDFVVQNNKSDTITKVHYISPFLLNLNILLVSALMSSHDAVGLVLGQVLFSPPVGGEMCSQHLP